MMGKFGIRFVLFLALVVTLSCAVLYLAVENRALTKTNRSLRASGDALEAKAGKLRAKNRQLFKLIARNAALVKSVDEQKKNLEETINLVKKENEAIQYEMKKLETEMNSAIEEKTYLEDMLIHKTREIDALKSQDSATSQNAAAIDTATATSSDISARIKEKEEAIRKLTEQNRMLSAKMDRLYQVTTGKISEINVAKIALEETVTGAKDKIDQEWNTVNLGSISVDKKDKSSEETRPSAPARSGPKTRGKVLAINEDHGFVVVNLGKIDNLNSSANLEIVREGKSIAALSVLEIRDVMAACNIKNLADGQKIQINDVVQIRK